LFSCPLGFRKNAPDLKELTQPEQEVKDLSFAEVMVKQKHVGLCDEDIVKDTCLGKLDIDGSGSATTTKVSAVSHAMWATRESTMAFLKHIGIDGENVNCMELCKKTLKSINERRLPPYSDVGCVGPDGICDIDLSPRSMEGVVFEAEHRDFHAGHPLSKNNTGQHLTEHAVRLNDRDDVSIEDAQIKIANFFRVYPRTDIVIDVGEDGSSMVENSNHRRRSALWEKRLAEVERVSVKAQAYVATAIRKASQDSQILETWMGSSSESTRAQMLKVLNSLSVMLSHVDYRTGPQCDEDTYAYVYPSGRWSKAGGNFIFFLCDLYFDSDEGAKIETLTHEGSHHAVAYTDDICLGKENRDGECKGETAYGRDTCKLLAKTDPEKAQNNADNFCYYINDINGN